MVDTPWQKELARLLKKRAEKQNKAEKMASSHEGGAPAAGPRNSTKTALNLQKTLDNLASNPQ